MSNEQIHDKLVEIRDSIENSSMRISTYRKTIYGLTKTISAIREEIIFDMNEKDKNLTEI
jgi:cAMP phosphodiesterase